MCICGVECPPKWNILLEVVKEIRQDYQQKKKRQVDDGWSTTGRVLLIVRDELAMTQIRDVLTHGAQYVMDQRFRWFVSQQSADIRKRSMKAKSTTINKQVAHAKAKVQTTLDQSTTESSNFEFNERAVEELLNRDATDTAESASSSSSLDHSYLELGLHERDLKALSKESQLLLIQERVLKSSTPSRSVQDQSSATSASKDEGNTQARKKQRTDANKAGSRQADHQDSNTLELSADYLDPNLFITIQTHSQLQDNFCWISEFQPTYIILYDADVELIRNIESYQSTIEQQIQLYFLVYGKHSFVFCEIFVLRPNNDVFMTIEGSTEEHRYVGSLAKEKKAFETLITTKEHLVISLPDHPFDLQKEKEADNSMVLDSRMINNKSYKSRSGQKDGRKVVVDVREFRSTLPSILYSTQFQIIPRTINVGDFVLSPEICVERKGISDLHQSFASGRLYNQVESMSRHYKYPCLLIEFTPEKPFCFMVRLSLLLC